jgi:hypothetical protein
MFLTFDHSPNDMPFTILENTCSFKMSQELNNID